MQIRYFLQLEKRNKIFAQFFKKPTKINILKTMSNGTKKNLQKSIVFELWEKIYANMRFEQNQPIKF